MTDTREMRGLAVELTDGFVGLPTDTLSTDDVDQVRSALEELFGTESGDDSAAEVAQLLSTSGQVAGAGGMEFAAVGFFHSPDDIERPVTALVTGTRMPAGFESRVEVIAGLQETFAYQDDCAAQAVELSAGQALLVTRELPLAIPSSDDEKDIALLQREVTAWIPDPSGTALGVISVSSPSWQDWAHVCDLALTIFDSAQWEPLGEETDSPQREEGV